MDAIVSTVDYASLNSRSWTKLESETTILLNLYLADVVQRVEAETLMRLHARLREKLGF
jgi:hypothetical protein